MQTWLMKLIGETLVSKIITGLIVAGVVVAGGAVNYRVFNQYKQITYDIADVQLVDYDWEKATFRITMDVENPAGGMTLANLSTMFYLENIGFADFDTSAIKLVKGHNRIVFDNVHLQYKGFGKGSLESIMQAWKRPENIAHFGYDARFKIKNLFGIPGGFVADLMGLNDRFADRIPFEIPGLKMVKVIVNYTVIFWDKSLEFREQVYTIVMQNIAKIQDSPKFQAFLENSKTDVQAAAVIAAIKVDEFMNSRNVQRIIDMFNIDEDQFIEIYNKAKNLFDQMIRMGLQTWMGTG